MIVVECTMIQRLRVKFRVSAGNICANEYVCNKGI